MHCVAAGHTGKERLTLSVAFLAYHGADRAQVAGNADAVCAAGAEAADTKFALNPLRNCPPLVLAGQGGSRRLDWTGLTTTSGSHGSSVEWQTVIMIKREKNEKPWFCFLGGVVRVSRILCKRGEY